MSTAQKKHKHKKHKHHDAIVAWANGATIEYRSQLDDKWQTTSNPAWYDHYEYRVKEEVKYFVFLPTTYWGDTSTWRIHLTPLTLEQANKLCKEKDMFAVAVEELK